MKKDYCTIRRGKISFNSRKNSKIIIFVLSFLLLLVYSACGKKTNDTTANGEEQKSVEESVTENASTEATENEASTTEAQSEDSETKAESAKDLPDLDLAALPENLEPCGFALDGDDLLITDSFYKKVWRVTSEGVEVLAGADSVVDIYDKPVGGYNDGEAAKALFRFPWAVSPFLGGFVISDTDNDALRLIRNDKVETVNAAVSKKLTGKVIARYNHPTGLATDEYGNLFVSDTHSGSIGVINISGEFSTIIEGLDSPMGLCYKNSELYIAETGKNRIIKLPISISFEKKSKKDIEVVAGTGEVGFDDAAAEEATFSSPMGVAVGDNGEIFVSDTVNGALRKIADGQVTTIEVKDEDAPDAQLTSPIGVCVRGDKIYVADNFSRKIFVVQYE